jgi:hypothetical protein
MKTGSDKNIGLALMVSLLKNVMDVSQEFPVEIVMILKVE